VVEFGVVTLLGGEIAEVHTRLCRPSGAIPVAETRCHGLSANELAEVEPFAAEWTRFAAWRERGVFAAHFSATEHALLRAVWPCPRLSPDFLRPGHFLAEWGPWIDTGRLAVERRPNGGGAALGEVVQAFGLQATLAAEADRWCAVERRRFHCALFDAIACALVLQVLARDAVGEPWSLARVLAASTANPHQREQHEQARWF
jgi:DNA polymerase-3 subunit epsilon